MHVVMALRGYHTTAFFNKYSNVQSWQYSHGDCLNVENTCHKVRS